MSWRNEDRPTVGRTLVYLLWVVTMAFFFANAEIQIEGGAGWATSLPTWRIENSIWLDIFWGGRAMTGYFAPPAQMAEFFGLWSFATRLAGIVGPLAYGAVTWLTAGNQRIAILSTAVLFVAGLLLLWPIDVRRGREAALRGQA